MEAEMKVRSKMNVNEVLKINEHMLDAFVWLAPEFSHLLSPVMRKSMASRVSVEQAARMAHVPLTEALYLLNLAAGEDEEKLTTELRRTNPEWRRNSPQELQSRPGELEGLTDDDPRVHFVDVVAQFEEDKDPRPPIMHGLSELRETSDVLLVHNGFDPIPLRDSFERRGFASWAEERQPYDWYIYFYRPGARTAAAINPSQSVASFFHTASAGS
jgi:hypothetical protein